MKFTEFIKDYVKKNPGIKYKDAIKDKKVRCLWHAHRGKEIGCPSDCPPTPVLPERVQHSTLPRPAAFDLPTAQYVPQAGGRRYRDIIPNSLGRNATRDSAVQTTYVDADGRVDENIPQNTGRVNLFSALLPRNIFQTTGRNNQEQRNVPEYIELNQDLLDAETVSDNVSVLDDETMPDLQSVTTASTQRTPVYPEYPEEENIQEVVSPVQAEVQRINNKYVTDGMNYMMNTFRPYLAGLTGPQTHKDRAANTLINFKILSIPNVNNREQFVKGLNTGNDRNSLWKVSYDREAGNWKYDRGPGGGRIKGGMAIGNHPAVRYPEYKNYNWVQRTAREIREKYPLKMGQKAQYLDDDTIDDLRRMELHRRYHLEEMGKSNEEQVLSKKAGNEGINLIPYKKPVVLSGKEKGSGFFDSLGLTGHWANDSVKGSNYSRDIFGKLKDGGLVEQYRQGAGPSSGRDDILDNERWTNRKKNTEERREEALDHARNVHNQLGVQSGMKRPTNDAELFQDAREKGKKFTKQQDLIEGLNEPGRALERIARGQEELQNNPIYRTKELQKKADRIAPGFREEQLERAREKRAEKKVAEEQRVAAAEYERIPIRGMNRPALGQYSDPVMAGHRLNIGDRTQLDLARYRIGQLRGEDLPDLHQQIVADAARELAASTQLDQEGYESEGSIEF